MMKRNCEFTKKCMVLTTPSSSQSRIRAELPRVDFALSNAFSNIGAPADPQQVINMRCPALHFRFDVRGFFQTIRAHVPAIVIIASLACSSAVAGEFDLDEYEQLHQSLAPPGEAWQSIPWHSNLTSAQQAAIEQNKPLFIWAMDGHPLGCT